MKAFLSLFPSFLILLLCISISQTKHTHQFDEEAAEIAKAFRNFGNRDKKPPIVLIPGLIGTRMISWKKKQCFGSNIDIQDIIWFNFQKFLETLTYDKSCWLDCMKLSTNVTKDSAIYDNEDCILRPDEGLGAIGELSPGNIYTPPGTSIFTAMIRFLTEELHYDSNTMVAIPYDWRLSPKQLSIRDQLFVRIKQKIEMLVTQYQLPVVVIAHSMGNNLFHYFLEWLETSYSSSPQEGRSTLFDMEDWLEKHVYMYLGYAAPLLGASAAVKATLSGHSFGLPLSEHQIKPLLDTFPSTHFLLPRTPKHLSSTTRKQRSTTSNGMKDSHRHNDGKVRDQIIANSTSRSKSHPRKLIRSFPAMKSVANTMTKNDNNSSSNNNINVDEKLTEEGEEEEELSKLANMEYRVFGSDDLMHSTNNRTKHNLMTGTTAVKEPQLYAQTHWSTDFFSIPLLTLQPSSVSEPQQQQQQANNNSETKDQEDGDAEKGQYRFTIHDLETKHFWDTILQLFPDNKALRIKYEQYLAWYEGDEIQPMLHAYKRPAIRHVYMIYGIDLPTELQYVYTYTPDTSSTTGSSNNADDNKKQQKKGTEIHLSEILMEESQCSSFPPSTSIVARKKNELKHKKESDQTNVGIDEDKEELEYCPVIGNSNNNNEEISSLARRSKPTITTTINTTKLITPSTTSSSDGSDGTDCLAGVYRNRVPGHTASSTSSSATSSSKKKKEYLRDSVYAHSGDNTVPYYSLSYAHTWLYHNTFSSSPSSSYHHNDHHDEEHSPLSQYHPRDYLLNQSDLMIWKEYHPPLYPATMDNDGGTGSNKLPYTAVFEQWLQTIHTHTQALTRSTTATTATTATTTDAAVSESEDQIVMISVKEKEEGISNEELQEEVQSEESDGRRSDTKPSLPAVKPQLSPAKQQHHSSTNRRKEKAILPAMNVYHSDYYPAEKKKKHTTTILEVSQLDHLEILKFKPLMYEVFNQLLPVMYSDLSLFS